MDVFENTKPAIVEPELLDLEREKIRFEELTLEVKAVHAELINADQAVRDFKNQRLREIEAHRDAVGRKQDRILKEFNNAKTNLEKKGVFCG